jgi:hypothetical protein
VKQYKLIKEIPGCDSGALFEETEKGYVHKISKNNYIGFPKCVVEDNVEWFEELWRTSDIILPELDFNENLRTKHDFENIMKLHREVIRKLQKDMKKMKTVVADLISREM